MGKKRVLVSYGVDIDAVAGWLGSVRLEHAEVKGRKLTVA